jgi:hypothetical protein
MKETEPLTLQDCDTEEIEDVLPRIERSFRVKFPRESFAQVKTFGDLCDVIAAIVSREKHLEGCTSQQAFYQLRTAIAGVLQMDASAIAPATSLKDLFPKKGRRRKMRQLQRALGVELGLLEVKPWTNMVIVCAFVLSFIYLFIQWKYGLLGLLASYIGNRLARRLANQLREWTVGEVARVFVREHYQFARRHRGTVNRDEIAPIIKETFSEALGLEPKLLTPEAPLF